MKTSKTDKSGGVVNPRHHVRLPGFLVETEIGLGDAIKRTTSYLGIKPCGGCQERAKALNRFLTFTKERSG